jgi:PAS domain S-box-containing protein
LLDIAMKKILLVSSHQSVAVTRRLLLEKAGYVVTQAASVAEASACLAAENFNLVLAGVLLQQKEQVQLACAVKERRASLPFVGSHSFPVLENEDAVLAPLDGPEVLLQKVGELIMREHGHAELTTEYFAFVDRLRVYVHVSDGVCKLLGYDRDELIGKRIDDVTYPESADVPTLFHRYLHDGAQEGRFRLRHKNGQPVLINYKARVLEDGCLVSEMQPVQLSDDAEEHEVLSAQAK